MTNLVKIYASLTFCYDKFPEIINLIDDLQKTFC
mgnify:CR=1 FL=1